MAGEARRGQAALFDEIIRRALRRFPLAATGARAGRDFSAAE
jgi:hypothetical protein